jgi:hypothetical protein
MVNFSIPVCLWAASAVAKSRLMEDLVDGLWRRGAAKVLALV